MFLSMSLLFLWANHNPPVQLSLLKGLHITYIKITLTSYRWPYQLCKFITLLTVIIFSHRINLEITEKKWELGKKRLKMWVRSRTKLGFPTWSNGKNPPANAGDTGDMDSIPEFGRSPGEGNGNPLQYLCWEIPWTEEPGGLPSMGSQSRTQLSGWTCMQSKMGFRFPSWLRW